MEKNDAFLQTLDKYGVLDNFSNKISKFYFDKIIATKTIIMNDLESMKYGWIYLSVTDGNNFELYYNDLCLVKCSTTKDYLIPCIFESSGKIVLNGISGEVKLFVYGNGFFAKNSIYLLPKNNYIVKDRGNMCLLSYSTLQNIKNNELTQVKQYENCLDIQEKLNGDIVWLANKSDGVYLCIETNENTTEILVGADISDACLVRNYGGFFVVYIRGDDVYYRGVSSDYSTLTSEYSLDVDCKYVPRSFSTIQLVENSACGFVGVNFEDGGMHIYKRKNSSFERVASKKADYSKLIIDEDYVELITMTDYEICINRYTYSSTDEFELQDTPYVVYNANDLLKIEDKYLVFSNGVCTEVAYDPD